LKIIPKKLKVQVTLIILKKVNFYFSSIENWRFLQNRRLNNSRNGVYNLETKQTLENSFNIENIYNKSDKHIKKYLNHHNKNSEVFGLIFARDCAGSKVIEHITELEQKMMARYHKILNQYLADRFGKETVNE
jgi:hypothetical protein